MQYLLTISTDEGDTVFSHSVDSLTAQQVAEIEAHFSEAAKDDETGPATGEGMDEFTIERLSNAADATAEELLSISRDLAQWAPDEPTAGHTLAGIQRALLKEAQDLADLASRHSFETRRR